MAALSNANVNSARFAKVWSLLEKFEIFYWKYNLRIRQTNCFRQIIFYSQLFVFTTITIISNVFIQQQSPHQKSIIIGD